MYSNRTPITTIAGYVIQGRHITHCVIDEKTEIMVKAMVSEYLRTGINHFTKQECERLCGMGRGCKWLRNRFKKLLVAGYLESDGCERYGVKLNLDRVRWEVKDDEV